MIINTKPKSASIINDNSTYTSGGIALNASVALNSQVQLGGSDIKIGYKPESALIWKIEPHNISAYFTNSVYSNSSITLNAMIPLNYMTELGGRDIRLGQKPNSALLLNNNPYNGWVLKNYNYTVPTPVGKNSGQPMGLLLCLTYP